MTRASAKPTWSALRKKIKTWETPELQELVKDLFKLSADNRAFLAARLISDDTEDADLAVSVAAPYRQRIHDAFYDKGGWPRNNLRLADVRKAIRDYRKATSDEVGTLNLMIAYVETGTDFILKYGGEDDSLLNSLSSVMNEIEAVFSKEPRCDLYERFQERILDLGDKARGIGWGYGDYLGDLVGGLEDRWSSKKGE